MAGARSTMEQQERQKQLDQAAAAKPSELPAETPASAAPETPAQPTIMPPSTGEPVSAKEWPYNKDLPVEEIDPGYQAAVAKEEQAATDSTVIPSESEQAPIHHG